ncbi:MAG: TlpA family protein disulfide reductase [Deltaproteobacteria bacterium]|jgi:thiol-disulfide isomerase/thioredoxin|nr:TlpA family protein disulfide reductase [Deltaproteobacteria bacterium]
MSEIKLFAEKWLNVDKDFSEKSFSGKVVAIHAFQMLCPGCILHGIPQAQRLHEAFNGDQISVVGLHTVFEHHEAMAEVSLKAFLHEFRVKFPVGIDVPSASDRIPRTMDHYKMQGTPTWLVFDRNGKLVINAFGKVEDIVLSSLLTQLALSAHPSSSGVLNESRT